MKTVMIIDDMPINLNVIADMILDKYKIMVATSGKKALNLISKRKPDLILLDFNMPEMNGSEVAKTLSEDPENADIPVVFISGSVASEVIESCDHSNIKGALEKPVERKELLAILDELLQP